MNKTSLQAGGQGTVVSRILIHSFNVRNVKNMNKIYTFSATKFSISCPFWPFPFFWGGGLLEKGGLLKILGSRGGVIREGGLIRAFTVLWSGQYM